MELRQTGTGGPVHGLEHARCVSRQGARGIGAESGPRACGLRYLSPCQCRRVEVPSTGRRPAPGEERSARGWGRVWVPVQTLPVERLLSVDGGQRLLGNARFVCAGNRPAWAMGKVARTWQVMGWGGQDVEVPMGGAVSSWGPAAPRALAHYLGRKMGPGATDPIRTWCSLAGVREGVLLRAVRALGMTASQRQVQSGR